MLTFLRPTLFATALCVASFVPGTAAAADLEGGASEPRPERPPRAPRERNGGDLENAGSADEVVEEAGEDRLSDRETDMLVTTPLDVDQFRELVHDHVRGESSLDGNMTRREVVQRCFDELDTDGDGELSAAEVMASSGGTLAESTAPATWPEDPEAEAPPQEVVVHIRWSRRACR